MKKIQYSYLPSVSTAPVDPAKNAVSQKSAAPKGVTPPNEETIAKLNAIAREYPFCAYIRPKGSGML